MLMRISLIVAIIAALAVGGLNFVKVKEKITTIQNQRETEKAAKEDALQKLKKTTADLKATTEKLTLTEKTLAATTLERDKAVKDLDVVTKRADKLNEDLAKIRKERDVAQQDLAAYVATGLTPPQILAFDKQIKALNKQLDALKDENKVIGEKASDLQAKLDRYEHPDKPVLLPAQLIGKVLVTDPKWNFVVLSVGREQGVKQDGELLVNRNGKLVAKIIVRSLQKDRSIANVMPGWQLGEILEGDVVIPAHPTDLVVNLRSAS